MSSTSASDSTSPLLSFINRSSSRSSASTIGIAKQGNASADNSAGLFESLLALPLFQSKPLEDLRSERSSSRSEPSDSDRSNHDLPKTDDSTNPSRSSEAKKSSSTDEKHDDDEKSNNDSVENAAELAAQQKIALVSVDQVDSKNSTASVSDVDKEVVEVDAVKKAKSTKEFADGKLKKPIFSKSEKKGDAQVVSDQKPIDATSAKEGDGLSKTGEVVDPRAVQSGTTDSESKQTTAGDQTEVKVSDETTSVIGKVDSSTTNTATTEEAQSLETIANTSAGQSTQAIVPQVAETQSITAGKSNDATSKSDTKSDAPRSRRSERLENNRRDGVNTTPPGNEKTSAQQPADSAINQANIATLDASNPQTSEKNLQAKDTLPNPLEDSNSNVDASTLTPVVSLVTAATQVVDAAISNVISVSSSLNDSSSSQVSSSQSSVSQGNAGQSSLSSVSSNGLSIGNASTFTVTPAASTSTTTASNANVPATPTLTAYQEQRVLQRVFKGLEKLSDGTSQVRLRLHPPELGSLQLTLKFDQQQVTAVVEVQNSATRDVLVANLPALTSKLSDQGVAVTSFDVQVVDPRNDSSNSGNTLNGNQSQNQSGGDGSSDSRASRVIDRLQNQIRPNTTTSVASTVRRTAGQHLVELDVTA